AVLGLPEALRRLQDRAGQTAGADRCQPPRSREEGHGDGRVTLLVLVGRPRRHVAAARRHQDVVKNDPTFWLLARASGLTVYVLLTMSVLAGLVLKSRPFRSLKPAAVTDTHRFLALLGLGAIALHGATLLLDRTIQLRPIALLVPGASPYRP